MSIFGLIPLLMSLVWFTIGCGDTQPAIPVAAGPTGTLTADVLMLRASIRGEVRGRLTRGAVMTILDQRAGWYNVKLPDGRTGWVAGSWIAVSDGTLPAQSGPSASTRSRRAHNRTLNVRTTGYYPPPPGGYLSKAEARMEGGPNNRMGDKLRMLHDFDPNDAGDYVSCATDPRRIRSGSLFMIDGYPGVRFLACDVGNRIKGARVDICVKDKAASYEVTGRSQLRFLP